ncbi:MULTISPECIES: hypothetical protein [Pseudarthrobacter]|uniref:hypothetical protein n=1 Tax=Pseudarthrobacter TaxID=1742993 RepID=UPI000CECDFA3
MGLWSWFGRRKKTTGAGESGQVVAAAPEEQEPLSPEQVADLEAAWAELAEAAKESAVTGFRACSRGGKPWQEDPASVRSMVAMLRSFPAEDAAAESPTTAQNGDMQ